MYLLHVIIRFSCNRSRKYRVLPIKWVLLKPILRVRSSVGSYLLVLVLLGCATGTRCIMPVKVSKVGGLHYSFI